MVLEFDVTDDPEKNVEIRYTDERPHIPAESIGDDTIMRPMVEALIRQKSTGWAYEKERRLYQRLKDCTARGGHYFIPINEDGDHELKRVIVGCRSATDVEYVEKVLVAADLVNVPVVRASMQPESYKVKC